MFSRACHSRPGWRTTQILSYGVKPGRPARSHTQPASAAQRGGLAHRPGAGSGGQNSGVRVLGSTVRDKSWGQGCGLGPMHKGPQIRIWGPWTGIRIQVLGPGFRRGSEVRVQPMQSGGQGWGTWIPRFGAGLRAQGTGCSGSQDLGVPGSEGPRSSVQVLGSETQGFSREPGTRGLRDGDRDLGARFRGGSRIRAGAQVRIAGAREPQGSGSARGRGPAAGHLRRRRGSPRWP